MHLIRFLTVVSLMCGSLSWAGGQEDPVPRQGSGFEFSENEVLVLLSRELAFSSDKVFGTKKKGMCGKTAEELQQILRAVQAEMDQRKIPESESGPILKKKKKCNLTCKKVICGSEIFKKLDAEKDKYGSAADGV